MRVKLKRDANAQQIAELHDALAAACRAVHNVWFPDGGQRDGMRSESCEVLRNIEARIREAMFSLEAPFMYSNNGMALSPLSSPIASWVEWLKEESK